MEGAKYLGCIVIVVAIQTITWKFMVSTFDLLTERKKINESSANAMYKNYSNETSITVIFG
jgi:hypothetical protein